MIKVASYQAHLDHSSTCLKCRPGRMCDEGIHLYEAMNTDKGRRRTPYVVCNQWGRNRGCWTYSEAKSLLGINGGEIIDQTDQFSI